MCQHLKSKNPKKKHINIDQLMAGYPSTTPMSSNTFGSFESSGSDHYIENMNFELPDFLMTDEWLRGDEIGSLVSGNDENFGNGADGGVESVGGSSSHQFEGDNGSVHHGQPRRDTRQRYAFKTESAVEVLDDGYKWRKYGKKMVKDSPNPRNYYKCSVEGCPVKKRVERDNNDPRYVITTYEGQHTHQRPN